MTMQLIENPVAILAGRAVVALIGLLLWGALRLVQVVQEVVHLVRWSLWPLLAGAGLVGLVVLCVACPQLPIGLGITAVVGWLGYPRKGGR